MVNNKTNVYKKNRLHIKPYSYASIKKSATSCKTIYYGF